MLANLTKTGVRWVELAARARERVSRGKGEYEGLRRAFYRDLWTRTAEEVGAEVEVLTGELLRLRRGAAWTVVHRSSLGFDGVAVHRLAGDKPATLRLLSEAGLPVPRHAVCSPGDLGPAVELARAVDAPLVVKPAADGSAGRGVTTGVTGDASLRRAAWRAVAHGRDVLCEEEVPGASLRLLVLDGELVDAIRRDPPSVTGDGRRSIAALIEAENAARLAGPATALHPLRLDAELRATLAARGLSPRHVPGDGERVAVKRVPNENAARDNVRVLDELHPDVVRAAGRAARALGVRLAGVDLLTVDATRPLEAVGGVVNEVNTSPGLHHHVLTSLPEPGPTVCARLLDRLLEEASR